LISSTSVKVRWQPKSPNGTQQVIQAEEFNLNFTLCKPGRFSPSSKGVRCLPCAVGYICPKFGMMKPIICPPGKVCDRLGLSSPSSNCPKGNVCLEGTKSKKKVTATMSKVWKIKKSENDIASKHIIDWPPFHFEEANIMQHHLYLNLDLNMTTIEHPIPCPVGYYCREGVSSMASIEGDFSTPQKCYDGFFCPQGSFSPEGMGPCRPGYYCPPMTNWAIECLKGHHCPGVANIKPTACHPGTFSNSTGRISCLLCDIGHICPKRGLEIPQLCPAGFICDKKGLSVPEKICTPGFICNEGTSTADIDASIELKPLRCPSGKFCLGGVARNISFSTEFFTLHYKLGPLECNEGFYCKEGSPVPTDICFPGHFCPPGTSYPIKFQWEHFQMQGQLCQLYVSLVVIHQQLVQNHACRVLQVIVAWVMVPLCQVSVTKVHTGV
jgi:hypothetical protein